MVAEKLYCEVGKVRGEGSTDKLLQAQFYRLHPSKDNLDIQRTRHQHARRPHVWLSQYSQLVPTASHARWKPLRSSGSAISANQPGSLPSRRLQAAQHISIFILRRPFSYSFFCLQSSTSTTRFETSPFGPELSYNPRYCACAKTPTAGIANHRSVREGSFPNPTSLPLSWLFADKS